MLLQRRLSWLFPPVNFSSEIVHIWCWALWPCEQAWDQRLTILSMTHGILTADPETVHPPFFTWTSRAHESIGCTLISSFLWRFFLRTFPHLHSTLNNIIVVQCSVLRSTLLFVSFNFLQFLGSFRKWHFKILF